MTWLADRSSLYAGKWLASKHPGLGITGAEILATTGFGAHGPGVLYPCVDAGDENKEFIARLLNRPTGTFKLKEDGTFEYSGSSSWFTWQLVVDGDDVGSPVLTEINFGESAVQRDYSPNYAILSASQRDLVVDFGIFEPVEKDLLVEYDFDEEGKVSRAFHSTYIIVSAVEANLAASYDVTGTVDRDLSAGYGIAGSVVHDRICSYRIFGSSGGLDPEAFWEVVLPNGLTAGQNLADIRDRLMQMPGADDIATAVWSKTLPLP